MNGMYGPGGMLAAALLFLAASSRAQPLTLDTSFANNGRGTYLPSLPGFIDEVHAHAIGAQANGRIVVGGMVQRTYVLMGLTPNGDLDTAFGDSGIVKVLDEAACLDLIILDDDRILSCGVEDLGGGGRAIVSLHMPDGADDTVFSDSGYVLVPTTNGYDQAAGIGLQSDGMIIGTGAFDLDGDGFTEMAAFRMDQQGQMDPAFGSGGVVGLTLNAGWCWGQGIAQMPDGRVVFGGHSSYFLDPIVMICRVMPDGSVDTGFGGGDGIGMTSGGFFHDVGLGLVLQPDGKAVLGGYHWVPEQLSAYRFDLAGELDASFSGDGIAVGGPAVNSLYVVTGGIVGLPDGSFVVVGEDEGPFRLVRFATDGSVLATTATFFNDDAAAEDVCLQPDGKLLVCGHTHSIPENDSLAVARYTWNFSVAADTEREPVESIHVFPNPVKDVLWVFVPHRNAMERTQFTLSDLTGKPIAVPEPPGYEAPDGRHWSIDLTGLTTGAYCLQMHSGPFVASRLVLKE